MAMEPAPWHRLAPRLMLLCGLLALITAVAANSRSATGPFRSSSGPAPRTATPPAAALPAPPALQMSPSASAAPPAPAAEEHPAALIGSANPTTPVSPRAAPAHVRSSSDVALDRYRRSLVWSGLIGLAIATIGFAMVGVRRRLW
jgi:predicted lipid-binding transport protein (Tim44 family)